jgi:hypothetical protein
MPTIERGKSGIVVYGLYMYYRRLLEMQGYLDKRSDFNVSFQEFCKVIRLLNKKTKDAIIYDSWVFKLPYKLGTIYIRKIKMELSLNHNGDVDVRKLVPDWPKTYALWEREYPGKTREELKEIKNKKMVYLLNEHTFGYKYVIHWHKKYSNVPGHGPYRFVFAKGNRRELARLLKSNPNVTYYE